MRGRTILVIDDNDTMREGMAVTLKKAGHEVVVVVSAMGDTTDELIDLA